MRLDIEPERGLVTVRLSRRNLISFLHFMHTGQPPVIVCSDTYLRGQPVTGLLLHVEAEDDTAHYARRQTPAGRMPPATEAFLNNAADDPEQLKALAESPGKP